MSGTYKVTLASATDRLTIETVQAPSVAGAKKIAKSAYPGSKVVGVKTIVPSESEQKTAFEKAQAAKLAEAQAITDAAAEKKAKKDAEKADAKAKKEAEKAAKKAEKEAAKAAKDAEKNAKG